jgi:hypothetical protein
MMSADDLANWVPAGGMCGGKQFDVIAVGMQESTFTVAAEPADSSRPQAMRSSSSASDFLSEAGQSVGARDSDSGGVGGGGDGGGGGGGEGGTGEPSTKSKGGWGGMVSDKISGKCSKYLKKTLEAVLGDEYERVTHVRAMQMRLYMYVHKRHRIDPSTIEIKQENTGLGRVLANKGGQVVKFEVGGMSLCFVSTHLAAHEGENHRKDRDDSVREIMSGARIGNKWLDLSSQFHHCFFMGR